LRALGLGILEGPDFAVDPRTSPEGSVLISCDLVANPSFESPNLRFELGMSSMVSIQVFDLLGNEISSKEAELQTAGAHIRSIPGLRSGVYYIRLSAGGQARTVRFVKQ
jgi:hypothetical protein